MNRVKSDRPIAKGRTSAHNQRTGGRAHSVKDEANPDWLETSGSSLRRSDFRNVTSASDPDRVNTVNGLGFPMGMKAKTISDDSPMAPERTNYAGNVKITNTGVVRPNSLDELTKAVRDAQSIRVIGRGHSFNEQLQSPGKHIDMTQLKDVKVDEDGAFVTVQAGATIRELDVFLAERGLALRTAPMIDDVTVGGSLATASHGTGLAAASFSDEVQQMEVIDAAGTLHVITDETDLKAARVGLGAAGVVYSVRLPVIKNRDMAVSEEIIEARELGAKFLAGARENERFDLFYYPGDIRDGDKPNGAMVRTFNTVEDGETGPEPLNRVANYLREHVIGSVVAEQLLTATVAAQTHLDTLGDWISDKVSQASLDGTPNHEFSIPISEAAHYFPGHVAVVTMEYSMPLEATDGVFKAIDDTIRQTGYVPEMAFYFRCMKGSDKTLLSPSRGRDSVIMESYQFHTKYGADPFMKSEAERAAMKQAAEFMQSLEARLVKLGGRSHPAKIFHTDQQSLFPDGTMQAFDRFRRKMDPNGKFLNDWNRGVLGLQGPSLYERPPVDWSRAKELKVAPGYDGLQAMGAKRLAHQLRRSWADFRRGQGANGAAVLEQESQAQIEALRELALAMASKKEELELTVGMGIKSPVRAEEIRNQTAVVDGCLHDLAVMAEPLGPTGVQIIADAARSLYGERVTVVDQRQRLELWGRANPLSPVMLTELPSSKTLSSFDILAARGFEPAPIGEHPKDHVLVRDSTLAHFKPALDDEHLTVGELFSAELTLGDRPDPRESLKSSHEANAEIEIENPVPLSQLSYNVALLDVKPFGKVLHSLGPVGNAISRGLEFLGGDNIESPDISDRRAALPDAIFGLDKDTIILQEVWNAPDVDRFRKAAEEHGYMAMTTPRDVHVDGLMTFVKKSIVSDPQSISQRARVYSSQDETEESVGAVKRGVHEVRFHHRDLGWVRILNSHALAYPRHSVERRHQMRTLGLMMADSEPGELTTGGGDWNAGPYYQDPGHVKANGEQVTGGWENALSYWMLQHFSEAHDAILGGQPPQNAAADITAARHAPAQPGFPHTVTDLNPLYAAQEYGEPPARLDHIFVGGKTAKATNSTLELTETFPEVGNPLSDHYGVSVDIIGERQTLSGTSRSGAREKDHRKEA